MTIIQAQPLKTYGISGPVSVFNNEVPVFDGTTGKKIKAGSGVFILDEGKVGIGTNNPTTKLQVSGITANDIITTDIGLDINPVVKPNAPSISLIEEAGNVDDGLHYYSVTYYTDMGETGTSRTSSITADATHGQVHIDLPISSDYRVTGRRIYRAKADDYSYHLYFVADIPDNTTTEYTDNMADADLGTFNAYFRENTTSKYLTINNSGVWLAGKGAEPNTIFGTGAGGTIFAGTAQTGANVLIGTYTGRLLTTGRKNSVLGYIALEHATTGSNNEAIGWGALNRLTTGNGNVAIGHDTGIYNETGSSNVLIGYLAGFGVSGNSYSENVLIGHYAGRYVTTAGFNTAVGSYAGCYSTSGGYNTFIGTYAGYRNTTGYNNTFIGRRAGYDTNQKVDVGASIAIGYNSYTTKDHQAVLGGTDITETLLRGKVGVGIDNPTANLHLKAGTVNIAPLKLTAGINLTTPEPGAIEFDGTNLYLTQSDGTRKTIAFI